LQREYCARDECDRDIANGIPWEERSLDMKQCILLLVCAFPNHITVPILVSPNFAGPLFSGDVVHVREGDQTIELRAEIYARRSID
jgi:hypothetical protein